MMYVSLSIYLYIYIERERENCVYIYIYIYIHMYTLEWVALRSSTRPVSRDSGLMAYSRPWGFEFLHAYNS